MLHRIIPWLVVVVAIGEGLAPGVMSVAGIRLPLTLVAVLLASFAAPRKIVWIGLAAGLARDVTTAVPLGFWTAYYTVSAQALYMLLMRYPDRRWVRFIWVALVILITAPYTTLLHNDMGSFVELFSLATLQTIIILLATAAPYWMWNKYKTES